MQSKLYKNKSSKQSNKPVKNKDFNRKVSTALQKVAESKHNDYVLNAGNVTGVPTVTSCFDPPQNNTDTGRIGDMVRIRGISLKYKVKENPSSVTSALFRILIVQWYDQTAPVIANILQNPTNPFISFYSYDRIRDNNNMKILYDKIHLLSETASVAGEFHVHQEKHLKYFKKKIYFNSGSNPPTNGALYLVYFSDAAVVGDAPNFDITIRSIYTDV